MQHTIDIRPYVKQMISLGIILLVAKGLFVSSLGIITSGGLLEILVALVPVIILHEGVHILVLEFFGAKNVGIGFKVLKYGLPIFYVRSDARMPRNKWIITALAPLVLSPIFVLIALLLPDPWLKAMLAWMSVLNTSSASGDMVLVLLSARFSKNALLTDRGDYVLVDGEEDAKRKNTIYLLLAVMGILAWPMIATFPVVYAIVTISFIIRSSIYLGSIPIVKFAEEKVNGHRYSSQVGAEGFITIFLIFLIMELLIMKFLVRSRRLKSGNLKA